MPKGFTIIEIIIVLVIGAVIMLAVFLVVPQLQRSARNSQRQRDAQSLLTSAYNFRDSGKLSDPSLTTGPSVNNTAAFTDYLPRSVFNDPSGIAYKIYIVNTFNSLASKNTVGDVTIGINKACLGDNSLTSNLKDSQGNVAIVVPLEPFTKQSRFCIDDAGE